MLLSESYLKKVFDLWSEDIFYFYKDKDIQFYLRAVINFGFKMIPVRIKARLSNSQGCLRSSSNNGKFSFFKKCILLYVLLIAVITLV